MLKTHNATKICCDAERQVITCTTEQTLLKVIRNLRAVAVKVDLLTADNLNTVAGKTYNPFAVWQPLAAFKANINISVMVTNSHIHIVNKLFLNP